ncbi:MAG: malate dehydrogenase, partial [Chlamydiia bacterium]|nr:malate dehydrogenase [Chlamydiia bacterium]
VPDFTQARIGNQLVTDVIYDQSWLQENFTKKKKKRGAAVIKARGKSSAASAANAAVDAMRSLYIPTPEGEWFTSAVCSDGNPYGIEEGLIFGFPCRSKGDGTCDIVPNLPWDYFIREKVAVTQKELLEERNMVKNLIDD